VTVAMSRGPGRPPGGHRPSAAELAAVETRLTAYVARMPSEGAVRRLVALWGEGRSTRQIAAQLAAEGFSAPWGGGWSHSTVARVLRRLGAREREDVVGG
jgi:Recombinase